VNEFFAKRTLRDNPSVHFARSALECGGASRRFEVRVQSVEGPNPQNLGENSLDWLIELTFKSGGWRHRSPKRFARNSCYFS